MGGIMRSTTLLFTLFSLAFASPVNLFAVGDESAVAAGNTAFALDLYRQIKDGGGNLFFSPYSISTCLAMTYAGARGETESQMAGTLHFGTNQAAFHSAFSELEKQLNAVQEKKDVELNIANGLWAQKEHPFLADFLDTAVKDYKAKVEQVDFRTSAEATRREINDWVSDKTKGKIEDLIGPGVLNNLTRLVLVNAIYFKGKWASQFKKNKTTDQPFFVSPNEKVQAKLMNQTARFGYTETDKLQLLELRYAGGDVSMAVLLPKEKDGLKALESSLNQKQLDDWLAKVHSREVNVFLPKFKLTQSFELSQTLSLMGMPDAFSGNADFSGMDGTKDLYISAVIHKAFVDLNEEGTEAAAATGVTMRAMAMRRPAPMPVFRADHPFLFLLRDTHSGSILFLGRVTDPTK